MATTISGRSFGALEAEKRFVSRASVQRATRRLAATSGPIDLRALPSASGVGRYLDSLSNAGVDSSALIPSGIDWVISGGESGPAARPAHPGWFRSLRDQCAEAGVPYLHKQNGEWVSVSEVEGRGDHYTFPDGATVRRVGKRLAGRAIDGVVHDGFPR